ncbi:50S ribosomal protein L2 [Candidatus Daviesbacteria bacterium RIFCSPHIGHO2_01_FULL_44_29]|nr:MAG: 50S ribosomal protein L2 [Candidatus Daviesbacteria bacterium RIFCSPHIGHO2_01_FULL_44_29]OGE40490.1 MAG: 50S ribosomal protein L2 [Candidatus Daviesbacteria bacterium RIFCSPHIGHO2_12_FULL_47_45]OGE70366.1 MAG: 50S ribosomal protein L2 [Candidatus Daviesbacteria bacterium RIFCSPLOWO2_01_FULL_43_15]
MLINYKEKTRTRRFASKMQKPHTNPDAPKALKVLLKKHAGRSGGKMTVRHQGGRQKRQYRLIDFKRDKFGVEGVVAALEYDPNRSVEIALINYSDGEKRYMLAPMGLKVGEKVISGEKTEIRNGNALKLKNIPIGTVLHNVEMTPGRGGQMGRSAGTSLTLQAREAGFAHLKLPSSEVRMVSLEALATIGVLGNEERKNINLGKAGRSRHMGIRPTVRGTAQDPNSHPHGGGEARSGVGRKKPMTKYGKPAVGNTRRKGKWTGKYILKRRKV